MNKKERAGCPIYKDKRMNLWLVPIFDKNTNKFVGSIYVNDGSIFIMGPQSYSEYKEIVYGKTTHKSDSNKHVKTNKSNNKSYDLRKVDIVGKSNPDILNDSIINIARNQFQKQHENELIQNGVSDASQSSSQKHLEIIR